MKPLPPAIRLDRSSPDSQLHAQHRIHPQRHRPLPLLEHMAVSVRGQHDRAVPQEVLHVLERVPVP
jgi:hypothetical protein